METAGNREHIKAPKSKKKKPHNKRLDSTLFLMDMEMLDTFFIMGFLKSGTVLRGELKVTGHFTGC